MLAMDGIPASAAGCGVALVRCRARRGLIAVLFVVAAACSGTAACGGAEAPASEDDGAASRVAEPASAAGAPPADVAPLPESPVSQSPALPLELSSPEHQRYQRLRLETLRAMIEAAKLALPIGPFQERIDAAARIALDDVTEAADRMEVIVADLQEAIAAAGR